MSLKLRVLIADDELLARKRLHRLLSGMPDVEVVGECEDGAAVLSHLATSTVETVDVVLLDIQMPGLSGVEAMALWPTEGPRIVFTTAHAEHAVEAFAGGAADYLLKPIEAGRLRQALDRVRAARPIAELPADRVPLPTRSGVLLLDPAEIRCVLIDGESAVLHTDRGRHFTDQRLSDIEVRLAASSGTFLRVHRRALVNLRRVVRLEDQPTGGYLAHTDGGEAAPVSRKVARELRRLWNL